LAVSQALPSLKRPKCALLDSSIEIIRGALPDFPVFDFQKPPGEIATCRAHFPIHTLEHFGNRLCNPFPVRDAPQRPRDAPSQRQHVGLDEGIQQNRYGTIRVHFNQEDSKRFSS
jgi:hypothetical protein